MILYHDTEKELTFSDYKPVNFSLISLSLESLYELSDNLEKAAENSFIWHSDMLAMAIDFDIRKVDLYITMKQKKQKKQEKEGR